MQPIVIDKFIPAQVAKDLNDFLRPLATPNPKGVLSKQLHVPWEKLLDHSIYEIDKDVYAFLNQLIASIQDKIDAPKDKITINRALYQVLREGEGLGHHADGYGGVDGYGEIGQSALLYLTNDYEGGEILFYDGDISDIPQQKSTAYKPDPGTLLHFRGDEHHHHSVNTVISGERANIILFFDIAK